MDIIHYYFQTIKSTIDALDLKRIQKIAEVIFDAYKKDKQIFIIGNGGSASSASHFACDLGKIATEDKRDDEKRFKAISLTDNVATITAHGNDVSYDKIFSQQLKNLINTDDVLVAISASGNSLNIIKAIEYANSCGVTTIGFLGFKTGGKAKTLVNYDITVQDDHYGRTEDIHLMMQHVIRDMLVEMKKRE